MCIIIGMLEAGREVGAQRIVVITPRDRYNCIIAHVIYGVPGIDCSKQ